ncbi:hypothetical protein Trydic_g6673 [Trypoxylus dichotomus]
MEATKCSEYVKVKFFLLRDLRLEVKRTGKVPALTRAGGGGFSIAFKRLRAIRLSMFAFNLILNAFKYLLSVVQRIAHIWYGTEAGYVVEKLLNFSSDNFRAIS